MFSNADELLRLEPEELAGPLLVSLHDSDGVISKNVISFSRRLSRTEPMKNAVHYITISRFNSD